MEEIIFRAVDVTIPEKGKRLAPFAELVRCQDCKYGEPMCKPWDDIVCTQNRATHCPEWFCADGERNEG